MAKKDEYKQFTFEEDGAGHTDNLTGAPISKGDTVYAVNQDRLYAGGAVLEATYNSMTTDGELPSGKAAEVVKDVTTRIRGSVKR